ncbi:hypothetical protein SAMN04487765_2820 [Tenacibaculum sp. MAR_2010_89]|uniref:tetratricopeptide repeat-containing sensor histidine kinase n=1 Tax=Tenacibaculum sp. MAR_2010_89 TaxID=1250198 RepID=UPI0008971289|nr:tetratricopeptide repeat protein [Tenacibaculum sp. MAR_2010_89]SEE49626.1 hypothetical protein SAMN04487765_2820 [Tenacibaculum sp. MAR_2010_89]
MKKNKNLVLLFSILIIISCYNNKENLTQKDKILKYYSLSKNDSLSIDKRKENLKKAFKLIEVIKFDSLELKMLNYNVILFRKEKNYKKAIQASKHLLIKALKYNDKRSIGEAYYKLGLYNERINQKDSAYFFYNKSLKIYEVINDSMKIGRRLLNIAIIESSFGDYKKSNATAVKALQFFDKKGTEYIASIYNNLGINSRKQELYEKAIKYYEKAITLSKKRNKINIYKNNIAISCKKMKNYDQSIDILSKILIDSTLNKFLETKARAIDNLAYVRWLKNSKLNVLPQFLEAKRIRIKEKNFEGLIASYAHLSDYYGELDKSKSLTYAYEMYNIATKEKSPYDIIEALDKISMLETADKGINFAIKRNKLKDSLIKVKDKEQYKYALVKYESEENEKKALKNKYLAEEQKTEKQGWIFIGLTTMLGFIMYIYYKRAKTKKEKVIEVYKTETRLAKKIHDELANDVYLAMNKIQNKSGEESSILADLEKIYLQTRNISHENSPVLTGNQFEGFLKQLFADFSADGCKVMNKGLSEITVNELSKEKQIVIYRVLQELLVNMKKYSEANLVIVSFSLIKDTLQIQYKDNGIGVETLEIKNGLQNMETRIKSIGGSIIFESEMQKGFQAKFQFKK